MSGARYTPLSSDDIEREADEVDPRLPEDMTRIGYDADTETYTYRDADGSLWVGGQGNRYGRLRRVGDHDNGSEIMDDLITKSARESDWRQLAPFMLLIATVLLLVVWLVIGAGENKARGYGCGTGEQYVIKKGETCWDVAMKFGIDVGDLWKPSSEGKAAVECDQLRVGQSICVTVNERGQN